MSKKLNVFSVLFIISLIMPIVYPNFQPQLVSTPPEISPIVKKDSPFSIDGNAELNATATAGNGTQSNPYILENYVIDASGFGVHAILINNTDAYFILRNCTVLDSDQACIYLDNISHGLITNNTVMSGSYGIRLDQSINNTISNNTVTFNWIGLSLHYIEHNIIVDNFVNNNTAVGIRIGQYCYYNNVSYNVANGNPMEGIRLEIYCQNNTIEHNTAKDNEMYGIWVHDSSNNNLTSNIIMYNDIYGLYLQDSDNCKILGNTILRNTQDFRESGCTGTIVNNNIMIDLITPANITYSDPMSGYYPATYGFENDAIGDVPYGWNESLNMIGGSRVIAEKSGHKNVVELYDWIDATDHAKAELEKYFSYPGVDLETIEFWYFPSSSCRSSLDLYNETGWSYLAIFFDAIDDDIECYYDNSWHTIYQNYVPRWYHIRADISYLYDNITIFIDGLEITTIPFRNPASFCSRIRFHTWNTHTGRVYVDAIGLSIGPPYLADSPYNIGDNKREGLVAGFSCEVSLDWVGYSLDGQNFGPILGNSTIPLPSNGSHSLQIIGNTSLGITYLSELRNFSVNFHPLRIASPANTTITAPMSGYYPATYSFESDNPGTVPQGWVDTSLGSSDAYVVAEKSGHYDVLKIEDDPYILFPSYVQNYGKVVHYFDPQERGTIDFWFYKASGGSNGLQIQIKTASGDPGINIMIDNENNGAFENYDEYRWVEFAKGKYADNTWFHMQIDFECGDGGYKGLPHDHLKVHLNGIQVISSWDFEDGRTTLGMIEFSAYGVLSDADLYFDAIGFSWDPEYSIGDNYYEGLLFHPESDLTLDWMGYSLDEQSNITITGDTSFPLPANGPHYIQLFGIDPFENEYASVKHHFTVHYSPFEILSPENKTYWTSMEGYYTSVEGFENAIDGTLPASWSYSGSGGGYYAEVVASKADLDGFEHKKVLYCHDNANDTQLTVSRQFTPNQESGTIEFWMLYLCPGTNEEMNFGLRRADDQNIVRLAEEGGLFKYYDENLKTSTGLNFTENKWYRISIDFESSEDDYLGLGRYQYRFRIYDSDGIGLLYSSPKASFENNGTCAEFFVTTSEAAQSMVYLDAFGYSWDPSYDVGDNALEGLLLNFTYGIKLESMGYILDSQSNVTVQENRTIPMPSDGPHTIQMVGLDWIGNIIPSFVTHLTINAFLISVTNHTENDIPSPPGILEVNPDLDLNITLTFKTRWGPYDTWTNASCFFKVNTGIWQGPFPFCSGYSTQTASFIIDEANYSANDDIYYYIQFLQTNNTPTVLKEFYWTQDGIKYAETNAKFAAFHKRANPVLSKLTLNYSVWFKAQLERTIESDAGYNVSIFPYINLFYHDISLDFQNVTSSLDNYSVSCSEEPDLAHYIHEASRNISKFDTPQFNTTQGVISPFTISLNQVLIKGISTITIPKLSFDSVENGANLTFTGDLLTLTYRGIEHFPYPYRNTLKFTSNDATIRFDGYTGLMILFEHIWGLENASQKIVFGLIDNNQSYPINLEVQKREEISSVGYSILPNQTLTILYDPPGDHSYSKLTEGTTHSIGFNFKEAETTGIEIEAEILTVGVGYGLDISSTTTESQIYDREVEISYEKTFTSSLNSENPDLIGPGRGDLYYGVGIVVEYYIIMDNYYIINGTPDGAGKHLDDIMVWENGSHIEIELTMDSQFAILGAYLNNYNLSHISSSNAFSDNTISPEELNYVEKYSDSPLLWLPGSFTEIFYSYSRSVTTSSSTIIQFNIDDYFAWHYESEDILTGLRLFESTGKIGVVFNSETTNTHTSATESNKEILCHLEDDDGTPIGEHDQFLIDIYRDDRYNTFGYIIYENFTYSSNPYEYGTRDRRPPVMSELFNLSEYVRGMVTLNCAALDLETGVNHVKFYYDNDPVLDDDSTYIGLQNTSTIGDPNVYQIVWDTTSLHGTYYLFAKTFDNAEPAWKTLTSEIYTVYIDNVLPSTCQARAYGPFQGAINLYANTFDVDSGIAYVEYWDGDPSNPRSRLLGSSFDPSSSFNFVWAVDPNGGDDGDHSIYARAYDKAGNYRDSPALTIQIDSTPPPSTTEILLWVIMALGIVGISAYVLNNTLLKRRTERHLGPSKGIASQKKNFDPSLTTASTPNLQKLSVAQLKSLIKSQAAGALSFLSPELHERLAQLPHMTSEKFHEILSDLSQLDESEAKVLLELIFKEEG